MDYQDRMFFLSEFQIHTGLHGFGWHDPRKVCLDSHKCSVIRPLSSLLVFHLHPLFFLSLCFSSISVCLSLVASSFLSLSLQSYPPSSELAYKSAPGTGGHLPAMRRSRQECDHWCSFPDEPSEIFKSWHWIYGFTFPLSPVPALTPLHWLNWHQLGGMLKSFFILLFASKLLFLIHFFLKEPG